MYSPEIQSQVSIWRQKAIEGTLTMDEMKAAIKILREGREAAQLASRSSTSRTKKPVNTDSLFNELDSLLG